MSGTVSDLGERDLVARIVTRVDTRSSHVLVGPGDDAAVIRAGSGDVVVTVDRQREGVHFGAGWLAPREIGARAVTTAASDIFAMGAQPRAVVVALEVPGSMPVAAFDQLLDGLAAGAEVAGAPIVGGDVGVGASLGLFTTVYGDCPEGARLLTRCGARPGDEAWVVGPLGHAAIGRQLLAEGRRQGAPAELDPFIRAFVAPPTPRDWCLAAGSRPEIHAMMDVSDGLAMDLHRMCEASRVGCRLEAAALDVGIPDFACDAVQASAAELALGGGEDYAMLCAVAPESGIDQWDDARLAHRIGHFVAESGVWMVADGEPTPVPPRGWDPFTERNG